MKEMFDLLVTEATHSNRLEVESVISKLGMKGRILDVKAIQTTPNVKDETKSALLIRASIQHAPICPICLGKLEPNKSVSYDHIQDKKNAGTGDIDNIQMCHPYCNNSKDSLIASIRPAMPVA